MFRSVLYHPFSLCCLRYASSRVDDEDEDEVFPIWKGMSAFEAGESEAPPAGVIVVDPFCDYLGKRCIGILEEAGYAVVQASKRACVTRNYVVICGGGMFVICVLQKERLS